MSARTRDLPQASALPKVRRWLEAVSRGHDRSVRVAGEAAGLSARHAHYYGVAATVTLRLATIEATGIALTALGRELLATPERSLDERAVLRRAIAESESVASIAPDLLDDEGPTLRALTLRLVHAGLSEKTARRRASTLLSGRRYVFDPQAALTLE